MYVKISKQERPLGLDEAEWLARKLVGLSNTYVLEVRKKMFANLEGPEIQFGINKWTANAMGQTTGQVPIWEGFDYAEFTGMLRMLIAVEEGNLVSRDETTRII